MKELDAGYQILKWWEYKRRDYPWRNTGDPYYVLVAEILLHRTRADQVVPVYIRFVNEFPDIRSVANSSVEKIKDILKPLGLTWRAELLHQMALEILEKSNGEILPDKNWLKSLPGVSDYIASAVLCFAFGLSEALLDTNTVRITGRLFGIPITDSSRRSKKFRNIYESIMDRNNPREFNLAMIDFGAIVCRAQKPLCSECPVKDMCFYYTDEMRGGLTDNA